MSSTSRTLNWGILGTGNIANQFAAGVQAGGKRSRIAAVASRTEACARAFAEKHQVSAAFGSYEAMLASDDIDAVYVSLPNAMHHSWTLASLDAGKHVLCEKPFALDAAQAEAMFDRAVAKGLLVVEAFMYVSHPLTAAVQKALAAGAIGELQLIRTSFSYRTRKIAGNVRFDRPLGGGALMDIGCYCIHFARRFAGAEPTEIQTIGRMHAAGVDELLAAQMRFPSGVLATFTCGMSAQANNAAMLSGSDGFIESPVPWKPPVNNAAYHIRRMTPPRMDKSAAPSPPDAETVTVNADRPLYALEADEFAAAALDGQRPAITREDTMGNMRVLDVMRSQIGLAFNA